MDIVVRKMDLSDIPYVYNEELKIFGKSLGEKTLYNEVLYNDLSRYFVVLVDDKRAGYVGSWLTIPNAEILNLFVSEKYRGLKLGTKLMDQVIKVCKEEKIEAITLEVRKSNVYAIKMYEDLGFNINHVRKNYYADKEDAYLMILELEVEL
jgi:ribosomal-protein-alanine N-acetyltransferase